MNFEARYKKLNTSQKHAVDTIDGPVMVVAGPGTGKTELLSMRAANILKKTDTLPESILCLTFTDSGANAMRDRLVEIIGQEAYKVAIHTFHSFGTETINQNSEFFYNGASFKPSDALSSYEVLHTIFDELDYTNPLATKMNDEYTHLKDVLTVISELKKSGLTSSELLVILDANEETFDRVEKKLATVFEKRISPATIELLAPIAHELVQHEGLVLPIEITPYSTILATSIVHAIEEAQLAGSTKPITAWKNQWLEKDETESFVFKSRKRQTKLRAVATIYDVYLSRMQEAELYDFDDMILQVVHTMETHPDLRFNLQEKYQYIMVDEFQDTNMVQARILHDLTDNEVNNGQPNILVVGDDDQAIYSFQGADISNIINFRHTYPETKLITLTDNYRSDEKILQSARQVITQGGERLENHIEELDKTLTPHHSPKVAEAVVVQTETKDDERQFIVTTIKERIANGETPGSIVVLARRHHEIISLLPYFTESNIPVNYEKRDNVLESEPVLLVETLSKLILALAEKRHGDAGALLPKLMAHPAWKFEAADLWRLSLNAYQQHKTWMEIMSVTPQFLPLHNWLVETATLASHTPLERLLDRLIGNKDNPNSFTSPFYTYFFAPENMASEPDRFISYLEALRTIRGLLRDYQPTQQPTLTTFIEFINLHHTTDTPITSVRRLSDGQTGAVHLMTAHKSKGLEFATVYITGAIDAAWGEKVRSRSRMISYPENLPLAPSGSSLDERLRLFFVAMTRAKNNLFISYATLGDNGKETLKASFLLPVSAPKKNIASDTSAERRLVNVERLWYAPLVAPITGGLKTVLQPTLEHYKLSATHLNNFLDVSQGGPENFLLTNLLRFPSAMSPHAAYGSAIHLALQKTHTHLKATGEHRPHEDILHDFEKSLQEKQLSPEEYELFFKKGSDSLYAFLTEKYDSFSAEQKVELSFSHQQVMLGDAHLTGALDLVDINNTDKTIHVTDYKTGKAARSWQGKTDYEKIKLHKYKQQLMFYKLLVEQSRTFNKYTVDVGTLQFVEPTPSGDIISLDIAFDDEELATFTALIQAIWKCIMTLDFPDISIYEPNYKGMVAFEKDLIANS